MTPPRQSILGEPTEGTISAESIAAVDHLPGRMTLCSLERGWTSLLLRRYDEPLDAEFETRPTPDQLIVLVAAGTGQIESRAPVGWRSARFIPGDIGMIAPGKADRLRFRSPTRHTTLQLHLPALLMAEAADLMKHRVSGFDTLIERQHAVTAVVASLEHALEAGAPAIIAETAAHYLAVQMVVSMTALSWPYRREDPSRENRLDAYMRENLAMPITLADMAAEIGVSVFQLIRLCHARWHMAPAGRLAALRLEHGHELLRVTDLPVTTVAMDCGYDNPSHFATAFRRRYGITPSECRRR